MKTISASASDQEINAAVAEFVAGWKCSAQGDWFPPGLPAAFNIHQMFKVAPYATSVDAVLPLLEARAMVVEISYCSIGCTWSANIVGHKTTWRHTGESNEPLSRAACLALLAAHGFTITT